MSKPFCLTKRVDVFMRMLSHIVSACQKFLARKPFECSYNLHEAQTFAIA